MYTFLIVLILIASVLMVLAVLVQNPKSGMASNFGASNQVMGVRQTTDFLEKFTWGAAATILALSLLSVVVMGGKSKSNDAALNGAPQTEQAAPQQPTSSPDAAGAAASTPAGEATSASTDQAGK